MTICITIRIYTVVDRAMGGLPARGKGYHCIGDRKVNFCLNENFVKFVLV